MFREALTVGVALLAAAQLGCEAGSSILPAVKAPVDSASSAADSRAPNTQPIVGWEPLPSPKWSNPIITILADGVEVESHELPLGRQTVALGRLRVLQGLPVSAWSDGRVVRASNIGILSLDRRDDERIRRNHNEAERILRALEIEIVWLLSA
jgi:hypothetical protein